MSDFCNANIRIIHDSREDAERMMNNLESWSKAYLPNKYEGEGTWLGNIYGNTGLGDPLDGKMSCDGYISNIEINDNEIMINTVTYYYPMLKMWDQICKKYYPDSKLKYTAEDLTSDILFTNEEDLVGKYLIDSNNDSFESREELDESELLDILREWYSSDKTLDELIDIADDDYIYIHQYERVDIFDLN